MVPSVSITFGSFAVGKDRQSVVLNSILHLFFTYFKFNSYKIETKNALNLAKPHDFSRDGRSHIVVDSRRF